MALFDSGSAPPPAPNPQATISSQNAANTLARNQNLVNTTGPVGGTQFTQDANGVEHAATTLSAPQQQLLTGSQNTSNTAQNEANKVLQGQYQGAPDITGTTNSLDSSMLGGYTKSMQPFFDQQTENQDAKLASMGLNPDSQAAELARMNMQRTQDAAISGAAAQFMPEAQQMAINAYNLPMQTSQGLNAEGRAGMASPTSTYAPNTSGAVVQPTASAGIINQGYQNQMQGYQAQNAANNSFLGGALTLGQDVFGGMPAVFG